MEIVSRRFKHLNRCWVSSVMNQYWTLIYSEDWASFKNIIKKLSDFPTPIWHYLRLDLWITQISACLRMYNIHKCHHAGNLWLKKMRNIENYFDDQILKFQLESEYDHLRSACLKDFIKLLKIKPNDCFWQEDAALLSLGTWANTFEW